MSTCVLETLETLGEVSVFVCVSVCLCVFVCECAHISLSAFMRMLVCVCL